MIINLDSSFGLYFCLDKIVQLLIFILYIDTFYVWLKIDFYDKIFF